MNSLTLHLMSAARILFLEVFALFRLLRGDGGPIPRTAATVIVHNRVSWMAVPAHESRRACPDRESGLLPVLIALPAH